jgi:hypothetical protein
MAVAYLADVGYWTLDVGRWTLEFVGRRQCQTLLKVGDTKLHNWTLIQTKY